MKKLKCCYYVLFLAFVAFSITSCNSDELQSSEEYDVSFSISNVTNDPSSVSSNNGMSKVNAIDTIIKCSELKADYVKYKIGDGNFKKIPVFYIAGRAWTNNIRLKEGTYVLSEFLVYSDKNTPDNETDDILLSATPHTGSIFEKYVKSPLNQTFTVSNDKKNEIIMEVCCFEPKLYECFGFTYFKLNEIKIRQLWFFSNFCIKDKADYDRSPYATLNPGWSSISGPFIDVPAILKVEVWRNDKLENTFSNELHGKKLEVIYADYLAQTDKFQIKLYILVRQGTAFNYVHFITWEFNDISNIPDRQDDGVIDGVLGNCYDPSNEPDFILAPWMNLPASLTYKITRYPSDSAYFDATLSNIPIGYELYNGLYASFCADHTKNINNGESYEMDVYSSLYPDKLPLFAQSPKWEKINWLYNHLDWYPGYKWYDIQGFIWLYDTNPWDGTASGYVPAKTAITSKMKTDADKYGVGYKVPPGGWASIIFVPKGTSPTAINPTIQTVLIRVDP